MCLEIIKWQTDIHCVAKNVASNFCNNLVKYSSILKILLLLETAINYLQNKYNTSRHLLKTSLQYRMKHKKIKSALLYQFLMTKLPNLYQKFVNC